MRTRRGAEIARCVAGEIWRRRNRRRPAGEVAKARNISANAAKLAIKLLAKLALSTLASAWPGCYG